MSVHLGGFFSGIDTTSIIQQLDALNRIPAANLQNDQLTIDDETSAFNAIASSLTQLKSAADALSDPDLFVAKSATSSNTGLGTVTADTNAIQTSFSLEVTQLATSSSRTGAKATQIPGNAAIASTVFGSDVVGTFTINGTQITLDGTETLNNGVGSIVDKINAVSGTTGVTASYDSGTGKFTLSSGGPAIVLATGSSSFLQDAELFNNGLGTVTSSNSVGRLDTNAALSAQSFAAALGANGTININGTAVTWTNTDKLQDVLNRITNNTDAVATYDSYTDKIVLTSKNRGANAITVTDTSGNLSAAFQLGATSTFAAGNTTKFKVNGGAVRESQDATLTADELGMTGVTVNTIATGTTQITVGSDTDSIKKSIDAFVSQYNATQNVIKSYTNINTDDLTRNGLLADNSIVNTLPLEIRTLAGSVFNASGSIRMLEDLGISGNSTDNTLTVSDSEKLQDALANHLDEIINMFTDPAMGLAAKMDDFIDAYATGPSAVISTAEQNLASQRKNLDDQIAAIYAQADAERKYLEAAFAAMDNQSAMTQQYSSFFGQINANSNKS